VEILGLGRTHRPVMLRRDEDWTGMTQTSLDDPDMPAAMKDPANWPAPLREELGYDWGVGSAGRALPRTKSRRCRVSSATA